MFAILRRMQLAARVQEADGAAPDLEPLLYLVLLEDGLDLVSDHSTFLGGARRSARREPSRGARCATLISAPAPAWRADSRSHDREMGLKCPGVSMDC